jgi:hypothetical protein
MTRNRSRQVARTGPDSFAAIRLLAAASDPAGNTAKSLTALEALRVKTIHKASGAAGTTYFSGGTHDPSRLPPRE